MSKPFTKIPVVYYEGERRYILGTAEVVDPRRTEELIVTFEEGDNGPEITIRAKFKGNIRHVVSMAREDITMGDWARGVEERSGLGTILQPSD